MLTIFGEAIPGSLTAAAVSLVVFCLLGAFDGLYFHLVKYQLHKHPESRLEHTIHTVRGALFVPIALVFFATNAGGALLLAGCVLLAIDLALELVDILVEKDSRAAIGGLSSAEAALHVLATGFRMAALAFVLATKPAGAFDLAADAVLDPQFPLAFRLVGAAFALGALMGTLASLRLPVAAVVSREGIPCREYRKAQLVLAVPVALAMDALLRALKPFVTEDARLGAIPADAIVVTYHADALLTLTTDSLQSIENGAYVGYHGFASYFPTLSFYRRGIRAIRFGRARQSERPRAFLERMLKALPGPVLIRTDSGGPYGRVRASIVDLALASGRPLVAVSQRGDRQLTLFSHAVPLPGCTVVTRASRVVPLHELRRLGRDGARDLMQSLLDELRGDVAPMPAPVVPLVRAAEAGGRG